MGTKTVTMTIKVPSSVVPTISGLQTVEQTTGIAAQFGAFVQSKSKIKMTITAAGAKGSTIKSYSTVFQGKTYTGSSFTSDTVANSGSLTVSVTVKDSRGRTAKENYTVTVLAYSAPKITKLTAVRVDSAGVAKDDGIYAKIVYAYSVASVGGKNTAQMTIQWKRTTETTWNSTALATATATAASSTVKPTSPTFSTDYQFDIRCTVKDWFGTTATHMVQIPTGAVIMDIAANGKGIAFGKTAEQDGIEFGWDIVNQALSFANLSGHYRTHDGLLIQWGAVSITPTAANTATTEVVTFPVPYAATPSVFVTPVSSVPHSLAVSVQRSGPVTDNKKEVAITLTRDGLTSTGINWLALGKG